MQNDVTYIAILLGLFAVMFLLVKACDLIIGSDEEAMEDQGGGEPQAAERVDDEAVAA